jgi:hypothetical protein
MRVAAASLLFVLLATPLLAAEPAARYGVAADLKTFPQATPQEALKSVVQAAEARRFDYLLAHLADPAWVDDRVKRLFAGKFEAQVDDTRSRMGSDVVKTLDKFVKDGKWAIDGDRATATLEEIKDRVVILRKIDGRWFLEHRNMLPNKIGNR